MQTTPLFLVLAFILAAVGCTEQAPPSTPDERAAMIAVVPVSTYDAVEEQGSFRIEGQCLRLMLDSGSQFTPVFTRPVTVGSDSKPVDNRVPLNSKVAIGGSRMEEEWAMATVEKAILERCGGPFFLVGSVGVGHNQPPPAPSGTPGMSSSSNS